MPLFINRIKYSSEDLNTEISSRDEYDKKKKADEALARMNQLVTDLRNKYINKLGLDVSEIEKCSYV